MLTNPETAVSHYEFFSFELQPLPSYTLRACFATSVVSNCFSLGYYFPINSFRAKENPYLPHTEKKTCISTFKGTWSKSELPTNFASAV
jgi:hypothetical protein